MENNEKSLLINRVIPNASKRNKIFCFKYFLISLVVVISLVFICGCFYKLYVPFKYEKVFNHIEISSKYDSDTYLPIVNFKVENTLFEAKLHTNLIYKLNYFEKFIHLISSFFVSFEIDSKKDSFFKLNTFKYEFGVEKLNQNNNNDDITCFNLSIITDKKTNSLNDMEYCVFLDSYSWFGGHGNFIYHYF